MNYLALLKKSEVGHKSFSDSSPIAPSYERNELNETGPKPQTKSSKSARIPSRRCGVCGGCLFWVNAGGKANCARCAPPSTHDVIRRWHWLPEIECKTLQ